MDELILIEKVAEIFGYTSWQGVASYLERNPGSPKVKRSLNKSTKQWFDEREIYAWMALSEDEKELANNEARREITAMDLSK